MVIFSKEFGVTCVPGFVCYLTLEVGNFQFGDEVVNRDRYYFNKGKGVLELDHFTGGTNCIGPFFP